MRTKVFSGMLPFFTDFLNKEDINYDKSVLNWYKNGNDYWPFHNDWDFGKFKGSDIATIMLNKIDDENC